MKLLYFSLLFPLSLFAQEWAPLTSIPTNPSEFARYDDVFFLNENLGWAANGNAAEVYKTTDGGTTWTLQLSEANLGSNNFYFRNVEFLNENIGFVGTLNGVFLKTIDGGNNWEEVTNIPTNPVAICGLDAVGTSTIYGCGAWFWPAFIIKSTDSGATWSYTDMSPYADALVEVLFKDENIGYASGQKDGVGGIILKTINGGQTWTQIYSTNIDGEYVWKLQILASAPNTMFGSVESVAPMPGKLIKSTNAGVTWVSKNVPDTDIQAVGFVSPTHGWMGGHHTGFLETFDAGATWTPMEIGSNLNRIFFIGDIAYASGSTIYKYSDALSTIDFEEHARVSLNAAVHPNPVKDKLTVTIEFKEADHLRLELFDNTGHMIKELHKDDISEAGKKTYTFDFPYASGVYLINLHTNTGRQSIKFVH
ncbi:MAG TPA: YCF48-related protein [Flavobacterium sp.]|jgi:photosystem II stability/assembly factor-like uncharacterized protein